MARTFKGGIHPNGNKEFTKDKAIELLKAPDFVILPMSMHIGAPCEPLVKKGDYVYLGQKIGDSDAFMSVPVHSSVSGTVKEIKNHPVMHQPILSFTENLKTLVELNNL